MALIVDTILEESEAAARGRLAGPSPGADLSELRLDALAAPDRALEALGDAIAASPRPLILTCRSRAGGGRFAGSSQQASSLLARAARLSNAARGVHFVDVEEDHAPPELPSHVRVIRSLHDFEGVPPDLERRARAMHARGASIVKVACRARSLREILSLLELPGRLGVPCVAIALGEVGAFGRILAGVFGMPFIYGTAGERPAAPGQLSVRELHELYRAHQLVPGDPVFALIGHPVSQSLSPLIHNRALPALGARGTFVAIDCEDPADLPSLLRLPIAGFSVTRPHKVAVLAHTDEQEPEVKTLGAANTLHRRDRRWVAANTDHVGFRAALEEVRPQLAGQKALVIGAGGAARAAVAVLRDAGARVAIANRTPERARELAREMGVDSVPLDRRSGDGADVIVQASACGMAPDSEASPVSADVFRPGQVAFDLVYNPGTTRFLREAAARGADVVSGLVMLAYQAQGQLERFTGRTLPRATLRELTMRAAAERGILT